MKMYQQQEHNLMGKNDFYAFIKVLKKYNLSYQFKQRLKQEINTYSLYGYKSTWTGLFARAFIQNKKLWVQEMKNILLDEHGMSINNRALIEKIIVSTLNPPTQNYRTTHMMIDEICYMIEN